MCFKSVQARIPRLWPPVSNGFTWVLALSVLFVPALMADEVGSLTPSEQFVIHQLESGKEADLGKFAVKDRILRRAFVENLITGGYPNHEIQRRGVSILHAIFTDTVEVSATEIPFRVWLRFCDFERGVDFSYTKFAHDLSLGGSRFGRASPLQNLPADDQVQAYFAGIKVEGTVDFSNAVFYVPVDFTYAQFNTDAVFDHVDYNGDADFEELTVKGPVFLRRDTFAKALSLADADLFELYLEDPQSEVELDLTQAQIARKTYLKNVHLSSWQAGSVRAHGLVILSGLTSSGRMNLAHGYFENLEILGFDEWLKFKSGTLNLEAFSFDTLDIGNTDVAPPAARLLELLNSERTPFSPQPYLELEKFLRAYGDVQKADEVYINMRRRQRQKLSWINRPWDFLLDKMLGYGKKAWRTVLIAILVIIIGATIFSPSRMEWKNAKERPTKYSRIWYSVDDFAPVVDLHEAKNWGPKQNSWSRHYERFHRIAGWILLPLVVGAITGIVK
jgi:Pentapeptide repeats (9 copies)